jgi:hypothetical protein
MSFRLGHSLAGCTLAAPASTSPTGAHPAGVGSNGMIEFEQEANRFLTLYHTHGDRDARFLASWLRYHLFKIEYPLGFSPGDLLVVSLGNSASLCSPRISVGRRRCEVWNLLATQGSHSNSRSQSILLDLSWDSTGSSFYYYSLGRYQRYVTCITLALVYKHSPALSIFLLVQLLLQFNAQDISWRGILAGRIFAEDSVRTPPAGKRLTATLREPLLHAR